MNSRTHVSPKARAPRITTTRPATAQTREPVIPDNEIVAAWECYADGAWARLRTLAQKWPPDAAPAEIADLCALAAFEESEGLINPGAAPSADSLFAELRAGMAACYAHDDQEAALLLGRWLLQKEYYCATVLRRFIDVARMGGQYRLLADVSKKFLARPAYQRMAVEAFFLANFHQDRLKEAVLVFEKFREQFDDAVLLQKAALALLRLERYQEAEELLGPLHALLPAADLRSRYEEVRADYASAIAQRQQLAKKANRTYDESMELGMAYLFSGEYDLALNVFQELLKSEAA